MTGIVLYPLLTTALFYLGSEAMITQFLWSRYPAWLDGFMRCPACVGFWWGVLVGLMGFHWEIQFLGLTGQHWLTVVLIGLCAIVWTPLLAYLHRKSLGG